MLIPIEIIFEIVQWIDDNSTINRLMQSCSTINDILQHLISHQLPHHNLKYFKIIHALKNLPKSTLETEPKSWCFTGFLNLWVCLIEGEHLYSSLGPYKSNTEIHDVCLLDSSYHYISNCHYLKNEDKIIVHLSQEREIIIHLWPKFYISSTKTFHYHSKRSPFCRRCEQLFPKYRFQLPTSADYQILLNSDQDVMFCYSFKICLNSENLVFMTYAKQLRKIVWVADQLIRVLKFYKDFLIVGYWKRSTKRQYRVYHIIDFDRIMEYQLISTKRGKSFGILRKVISLDMNTKKMTFTSKRTRFETILCPVDVHQFK